MGILFQRYPSLYKEKTKTKMRATKKQVKARATLIGCEIRYSGKLGRGFVHRIVRYKRKTEIEPNWLTYINDSGWC